MLVSFGKGLAELNQKIQNAGTQIEQTVDRIQDRTTKSLSERINDTSIMSKVYVDSPLQDEEIMQPLMALLNQNYVAFALTALKLNQFVGGTTVRNLLRTVATESHIDVIGAVDANFMENYGDDAVVAMESKVIPLDEKQQKLMAARVVEIEFRTEQGGVIIVPLLVQLIPTIIENSVMDQLISLNFDKSWSKRWNQYRAGEISFVSDFLCEMDLRKDTRTAMKKDDTDTIYSIVSNRTNKLFKYMAQVIGLKRPNYNIASSVLIIDKKTFDKACAKHGIDFSRLRDRNEFFKNSLMFMVVVIDKDMYNKVDIYYNGIDSPGNYNFDDIRAGGNKADNKFELKDIMAAFAGGNPPSKRF